MLIDPSFVAQELCSDCIRHNEDLMWGQEQAGVLPCQDIEGDCVCLHPAGSPFHTTTAPGDGKGRGPKWSRKYTCILLKTKTLFFIIFFNIFIIKIYIFNFKKIWYIHFHTAEQETNNSKMY